MGALTALPSTASAFFLIRKYQKQTEEKEEINGLQSEIQELKNQIIFPRNM